MIDRRTTSGKIVRSLLALAAVAVAVLLGLVAFNYIGWFISPDDGGSTGSAGNLVFAAFFLLLAGPFVAIALVLGMPLISNDPKYRNADR